jgi:putative membrane protein
MSEKERARAWVPPMELDPARAAPVPEEQHPGAPPDAETLPVLAVEGRPRSRVGRWLAGALGALLLVALGFDTADLLARAFSGSIALGAVVALAAAIAAGAAVTLLVKELRSLRRLRHIEALRGEAARLGDEAGIGQADRFAGQLGRLYEGRADLAPDLARLKDLVSDAHDDGEVVRLIDREVLAGIDRRAYQMVLRASRDTAVATALSPAALLDVVVVLWRNLKLVREVAGLYGAGLPGLAAPVAADARQHRRGRGDGDGAPRGGGGAGRIAGGRRVHAHRARGDQRAADRARRADRHAPVPPRGLRPAQSPRPGPHPGRAAVAAQTGAVAGCDTLPLPPSRPVRGDGKNAIHIGEG